MRSYNWTPDKTLIYCSQCFSRLRVPLDKGKIAVTCPKCRKEFIYNPNSILHTVKQIGISLAAMISKMGRKQLIIAGIVLILLAALLLWFFSGSRVKAPEKNPGPLSFGNTQISRHIG